MTQSDLAREEFIHRFELYLGRPEPPYPPDVLEKYYQWQRVKSAECCVCGESTLVPAPRP
jgi:hypothetical protein